MQNDDNKTQQNEEETTPTAQGRNAVDNFNDDSVDDYGIDYSKPGAEEELEARQSIKGGRGIRGVERNRNDDYEDKEDEQAEDENFKA
ncbi:hypothetical protein FEM33_12265 [Dyadobacter flavalbus]|uniref:Histone chaperone domain-containing protein n=1 Tax=Dyadobacter flavalbus TaxID=2579942 RepID=A0A5M8QW73_9BACT|nr:hypothetical protein [Dyadobacter flavalbus]KAA6439054.1 hypothetical protein FEM33_12265 [Dyadobacter flavalbus]